MAGTIVRVYDEETRVIIYGYELLAPLVISASASAAAAAASAAAAGSDALDAASSAAAALASEESAGGYLDGIEDLIAGIPLDPILPMQAITRVIMAGFTGMSAGRQAYLSEAGREGFFKWSTANNSANVTADPFQGLYVAPSSDTDGSSGAWVRIVDDGIYHLTWWGVTEAAADCADELEDAVLTLVPAGCTLKLPPFPITVRSSCVGARSDLVIEGHGREISAIICADDLTAFVPLWLWGDNLVVRGFKITGEHFLGAGANAEPSLALGIGPTATVYENWTITDMWFDGHSIGLIVSASNDTVALALPKNILIENCHFTNDRHGFSIFGAEDVTVNNPTFDMVDSIVVSTVSSGFRILGSKRVRVNNPVGRTCGHNGVLLSGMARDTGSGILTADNEDIRINGGHLWNAAQSGFNAGRCNGFLIVNGLTVESQSGADSVEGTAGNAAVILTGETFDHVSFEGCNFIGYNAGVSADAFVRHLRFKGNRVEGNQSATTYPDAKFCGKCEFGDFEMVEFIGNEFMMSSAASGASFRIGAGVATRVIRAFDNTFPEGAAAPLFNKPFGGTLVEQSGNNRYYPDGTFAMLTT